MPDKTDWRKMLRNEYEDKDLDEVSRDVLKQVQAIVEELADDSDELDYVFEQLKKPSDYLVQEIKYPVLEYPTKINSHNLDKNPKVEGTLLGIKGQYLILDTGVLNIRKFAGYNVSCGSN